MGLGVLLIFNPFEAVNTVIMLIGIFLIYDGISDFPIYRPIPTASKTAAAPIIHIFLTLIFFTPFLLLQALELFKNEYSKWWVALLLGAVTVGLGVIHLPFISTHIRKALYWLVHRVPQPILPNIQANPNCQQNGLFMMGFPICGLYPEYLKRPGRSGRR